MYDFLLGGDKHYSLAQLIEEIRLMKFPYYLCPHKTNISNDSEYYQSTLVLMALFCTVIK